MTVISLNSLDSLRALVGPALDNLTTLGSLAIVFGLVVLLAPMTRRGRRPKPTETPSAVAPFQPRPVLNASERRLHTDIERLMPQIFPPRARILSQVSIAEFVFAPNKADFRTIAASRVDMLIVDSGFQPVCAIEYQGAGHFGASVEARAQTRRRDWDKRRALRIAGVPLVEIPAEYDAKLLAERLGDVTGRRPEHTSAPPRRRPDLQAGA